MNFGLKFKENMDDIMDWNMDGIMNDILHLTFYL